MARIVNQQEYSSKRNEILDVAQQLVFTKGYERMSIQDILNKLGISKGAFYHYFDSKASLLEAYIDRSQENLDNVIRALVEDPDLTAPEKFQRYFETLHQIRTAQQPFLTSLMQIWFADDNAIVREKTDDVIVQRRAPLLNTIVRQGVNEGFFTTAYPDQAGQVILSITRGMGNMILKLMIDFQQERETRDYVAEIVTASAAMAEAIERVLGSTVQILDRPDADEVRTWLVGLSQNREPTT